MRVALKVSGINFIIDFNEFTPSEYELQQLELMISDFQWYIMNHRDILFFSRSVSALYDFDTTRVNDTEYTLSAVSSSKYTGY